MAPNRASVFADKELVIARFILRQISALKLNEWNQ